MSPHGSMIVVERIATEIAPEEPMDSKLGIEIAGKPAHVEAPGTIDDRLVKCAAAGEEAALEALYNAATRLLRWHLGRENLNLARWGSGEIGDIPQDILSRLFGPEGTGLIHYARMTNPAAALKSGLETALERRLRNRHRRWSRRDAKRVAPKPAGDEEVRDCGELIEGIDPHPTPNEVAASADEFRTVSRLIENALKPGELDLFLSDYRGEARTSLAARFGISEKAVATRVCRIHEKLRKTLSKHFPS